jgi:hypothetical protein
VSAALLEVVLFVIFFCSLKKKKEKRKGSENMIQLHSLRMKKYIVTLRKKKFCGVEKKAFSIIFF